MSVNLHNYIIMYLGMYVHNYYGYIKALIHGYIYREVNTGMYVRMHTCKCYAKLSINPYA